MKFKRSKATDITMKVKRIVFARDNGKCIICGNPGLPNAHYIRRTQNGLGIEENVVTLCLDCHNAYDDGFKRKEYGLLIKKYLKRQYGKRWNEKNLIYNKWAEFAIK